LTAPQFPEGSQRVCLNWRFTYRGWQRPRGKGNHPCPCARTEVAPNLTMTKFLDGMITTYCSWYPLAAKASVVHLATGGPSVRLCPAFSQNRARTVLRALGVGVALISAHPLEEPFLLFQSPSCRYRRPNRAQSLAWRIYRKIPQTYRKGQVRQQHCACRSSQTAPFGEIIVPRIVLLRGMTDDSRYDIGCAARVDPLTLRFGIQRLFCRISSKIITAVEHIGHVV